MVQVVAADELTKIGVANEDRPRLAMARHDALIATNPRRIRLLICSIDKAEQIGLDWWKYDHHLSPGKQAMSAENKELRKQVRSLERQLASLTRRRSAPSVR